MLSLSFAAGLLLLTAGTAVTESSVPSLRIWPIPKSQQCTAGGNPAGLSEGWTFAPPIGPAGNCTSSVVHAALSRYQHVLGSGTSAGALTEVRVSVSSESEFLGANTSYGYTVQTRQSNGSSSSAYINIVAETPFGVGYALNTLSQMLVAKECSAFSIDDAPEFVHRGLMIDVGRRFYPVAFVKRLMDGLEAFKMNVLHMHLSEQCFRVQSTTFPELSSAPCVVTATNDTNSEVYSHADISDIVAYGRALGIRIIPEFDIPGHSGGYCTHLKSAGIQCCGNQIEDDPEGKSVAIMGRLFEEMAGLFPDEIMHIGCDETGAAPPCTLNNTKQFEVKMIQKLLSIGKQPAGWEEVLFTTQAAVGFPSVVVHSWHHTHWQQVVDLGHKAIYSNLEPFYLGYNAATKMWIDMKSGETNPTKVAGLLGGEVSMWSDEYLGSCMFKSSQDALFVNSTSNYIFPKTAVAAGSFWRWDARVNVSSPAFEAAFEAMQARLHARSVGSCPCTTLTTNECSQTTYCGDPYCDSGAELTCDDYNATAETSEAASSALVDESWSCHTAHTGVPTLSIIAEFTIPCTSLHECLRVAAWRCNVTFAPRGCDVFSMSSKIDPKGGRGAVASFFQAPPHPPKRTRTDTLYAVACNHSDPSQSFMFDSTTGAIKTGARDGSPIERCVDVTGDGIGASAVQLKPCAHASSEEGSGAVIMQKFIHDVQTGAFKLASNPKACLDLDRGGVGPGIDVYHCDNDWNQVWRLAPPLIEEASDGNCFSDSAVGAAGLERAAARGKGSENAWTRR